MCKDPGKAYDDERFRDGLHRLRPSQSREDYEELERAGAFRKDKDRPGGGDPRKRRPYVHTTADAAQWSVELPPDTGVSPPAREPKRRPKP